MTLHTDTAAAAANMRPVSVLYEDDDVVVIDKPSGLIVHPTGRPRTGGDGRTDEPTLADWLLERYPEIKGVGEPWRKDDGTVIARPGIVHRLDRETSGVMVVAKTQASFEHLKKQFQERRVEKVYSAFVYGLLKNDEGVIDRPIGKSAKDFRMWSAQRGARGTLRAALTEYKVLKRLPSLVNRPDMTSVEVLPKTGRTHQIRVHFKAIHHPVVCDRRYAPKHDCAGFSRLALHARSIGFETVLGKEVKVEAPLPESFARLV